MTIFGTSELDKRSFIKKKVQINNKIRWKTSLGYIRLSPRNMVNGGILFIITTLCLVLFFLRFFLFWRWTKRNYFFQCQKYALFSMICALIHRNCFSPFFSRRSRNCQHTILVWYTLAEQFLKAFPRYKLSAAATLVLINNSWIPSLPRMSIIFAVPTGKRMETWFKLEFSSWKKEQRWGGPYLRHPRGTDFILWIFDILVSSIETYFCILS